MENIKEQIEIITSNPLKRRIKREFEELLLNEIIYPETITVNFNENSQYNKSIYVISFIKVDDNKYYEFYISFDYPFTPPKLNINFKTYSYLYYLNIKSLEFKEKLLKYKKFRCFCCETKLCKNNWSPAHTMQIILDEVKLYISICEEISKRVIIDVIKRKYLIEDINIIEWLY